MVELLEQEYVDGAPLDELYRQLESMGFHPDKIEHELEKLRRQGEVYEPTKDYFRIT